MARRWPGLASGSKREPRPNPHRSTSLRQGFGWQVSKKVWRRKKALDIKKFETAFDKSVCFLTIWKKFMQRLGLVMTLFSQPRLKMKAKNIGFPDLSNLNA
jgi:hypothetical protein